MDVIPADVLVISWHAPAVDSTHPLQSTSAPGDNYRPPSCPPPAMMVNEGMEVDVQTLSPTIVVSPVDPPTVDDAQSTWSPSMSGDNYCPPSCPPLTLMPTNDGMIVNGQTVPPPTAVTLPFDLPTVNDAIRPWSPSTSIDGHCPPLCPPSVVTTSGDGMPFDSNPISSPLVVVSPADVSNTSLHAPMVVVGGGNTSDDMAMDMV